MSISAAIDPILTVNVYSSKQPTEKISGRAIEYKKYDTQVTMEIKIPKMTKRISRYGRC